MTSITHFSVEIQTSPQLVPSTPSWLGEVAIMAALLKKHGLLEAISQEVRLTRGRMGHYEVIDFVALLIGYAISAEPTLKAFYDRLLPFATPFMGLFERDHLPHRSTLSRFLAAVDPACLEQLRVLFQRDLCARPLAGSQEGGLWDRSARQWSVFDIDGTRATARQRALPHIQALPAAKRRFDEVCAKGYAGRKRGEVVRTRTVIEQASTHHWLGTFSGKGNGEYRAELQRALQVIIGYLSTLGLPPARAIIRLDGLYGTGLLVEILAKAGLAWIMRGKDYGLLNEQVVKERLKLPPDQETQHPETGTLRQLFDLPDLMLSATGTACRVVVAAHPATTTKSSVGKTLDGRVYELFFTSLPQDGFLAADVLDVYFGRGGFESVLADEDREQDPDRWCSHTSAGQEFWQILSQWVWNLRIELGHQLHPTAMRTTHTNLLSERQSSSESMSRIDSLRIAPLNADRYQLAPPTQAEEVPPQAEGVPPLMPLALQPFAYGPPTFARPLHPERFAAKDFLPQPDGTLLCPDKQHLRVRARKQETNGVLRILYAAPKRICQACPLRAACLREGNQSSSGRHVSLIYHPLDAASVAALTPSPPAPMWVPSLPVQPGPFALVWRDWGRSCTRREWMALLRTQTVTITVLALPQEACRDPTSRVVTRSERKHWRLSWQERLARNASAELTPRVRLHLFGIPTALATSVGLPSSL